MPNGALEGLLDDIQRLAFVPDELGDIHIERPFVLPEEVIPSMGIVRPGGLDQGYGRFGRSGHLYKWNA